MYKYPAYLTSSQSTSCKNAGLVEVRAGIKITEKNINNLRYADDTTLTAESKEELKSLLMKVKEESEKAGLKLNIQKTNIMASSATTSLQIDEEKMGNSNRLYFLGFNSTRTENFQMFKLDLEKAEESEIKLPTSNGSLKKQKSSRKTSTSASLTMLKPLTVWITTKCGKFLKRWKYQTTLPVF